MKKISSVSPKDNCYAKRFDKIFKWMAEENISLLMLSDNEANRDQNIRYLTGHPSDAMLFISQEKAILAAWDINLANLYAAQSPAVIMSYNDFERKPVKAIAAAAKKLDISAGSKIEIPSVTSYPSFLEFVGELADFDIICREKGAAAEIIKSRAVKDEEETAIVKKAADITNELIDAIEKNVRSGKIKTEADAALFIENEARRRGCEGTSFGTLAAGPERSYAIHAFPSWTSGQFGTKGLSILDFGVKLGGYCTDVTLTFACDLDARQEKLVSLVEKASKLALSMSHKGKPAKDIAAAVDAFFSKSKRKMPHSLGHGIGLEEHEFPFVRNASGNEWILEPGMIFTIEPGLYDPLLGGCRLENDILITDSGYEILTTAKIIKL